jgi:hypothetical protein
VPVVAESRFVGVGRVAGEAVRVTGVRRRSAVAEGSLGALVVTAGVIGPIGVADADG